MTDVELAKKRGEEHLKDTMPAIGNTFSYEDTAYHLPISYALTGTAVHDQNTARDVFAKTGNNPIVASECILAEKTACLLDDIKPTGTIFRCGAEKSHKRALAKQPQNEGRGYLIQEQAAEWDSAGQWQSRFCASHRQS